MSTPKTDMCALCHHEAAADAKLDDGNAAMVVDTCRCDSRSMGWTRDAALACIDAMAKSILPRTETALQLLALRSNM